MDAPARRRSRLRTAAALGAVLALGAVVRAASYLQVRDASVLYFHRAGDTDMHFYDAWARLIAGGDLLAAPRPYHPWHHEIAREVHESTRPGQPFDETVGRAMWERWIGPHTFYQDPLYAYALAAVYRLFGPRLEVVLLAQALLGLGIVALAFALGRVFWDEAVAVVAGALAALYAPFVFYESTLLRGTLQVFCVMAAVTAATLARERGRPWWWMAAGLAAGLATLSHGSNLILALGLAALARWPRHARWPRAVLLYLGGLALALAPLVARNVTAGAPALGSGASSGYGAFAFISSHAADADPRNGFPFSPDAGRIMAVADGRLLPTVRETLATHSSAWSWLALMGRKLLAFFDAWENADNVNFYYFLLQSPLIAAIGVRFGLLLPLFALGLACSGRRALSPPGLAVLCGVAIALVFFTASRVRLSAAAAMIPFAGAGIVCLARGLRAGRARALAGPLAAAAAAGLLAAAPWWPRLLLVRPLDYRTGNDLALARYQHERRQGRAETAARVLRKQLATEPAPLRGLDPRAQSGGLPEWAAWLAASYADLHRAAVAMELDAGRPERALPHAEHARLLTMVARTYAARPGS